MGAEGFRRSSLTRMLCAAAFVLPGVFATSASAADTVAPIARFTCSAPGLACDPCPVHCTSPTGRVAAGVAVAFDARPSTDDRGTPGTPNGTVVDYEWEFGSDGVASGAQPTHAFSRAGTFPVMLKAVDASGNFDTKTLNVVVTDAGPPPPPPPPSSGYVATVTADAPSAYWRLGESSGTVAFPAVGASRGTYRGSRILGLAGAITGDHDTAVGLNGTNAYVSVPDAPALDSGDTFTLEAWVKRGRTGITQGLLSKGSGSYQLYLDAANQLVLRKAGTAEIARSSVSVTDKTSFHHLVVTKSAASIRIYIDGVDRTGRVANRGLASTATALTIGGGAGLFNGAMDEVAIYSRALAAAAVGRHYAAGRGQ